MVISLLLLYLGACWFGYLTSELLLGIVSTGQGALFIHPHHLTLLDYLVSLVGIPFLSLLILFTLIPMMSGASTYAYVDTRFLNH